MKIRLALVPVRVLASVGLGLVLVSCAHKKSGPGAGPGSGGSYGAAEGYSDPYGDEYAYERGGDGGDIPLPGRPDGVNFFSSAVRRDLFPAVYFGFDRSDIPNGEFPKVQQVAAYLRANPGKLIVAGHTDSVGTSEYNRNLGELRALALRSALVQLGVNPSQVQTVSYGEDAPADPGQAESAHAANRRGEFGYYR
jgi:peptidoglycan-associated lipoprotein